MRWDEMLDDVFEDLEQQAEGLHLAERDAEVADRGRAEYALVDFASRLHASTGGHVVVRVTGVGPVVGTLARAGSDWCLLETEQGQEWIVRLAAISAARGLSERAAVPLVRPVVARLGLRSALRGVVEMRSLAVLHSVDGSQSRGLLRRVGADFVEVLVGDEKPGQVEIVPFGLVAAVRRG